MAWDLRSRKRLRRSVILAALTFACLYVGISWATAERLTRGEALRRSSRCDFDRAAAEARFDVLIGAAA